MAHQLVRMVRASGQRHPPTASRFFRWATLLLIPILVFAAAEQGREARGPFFLSTNQDPAYSYLVGSGTVGLYGFTHFFHHPGLTTQVIGALALAGAHQVSGENDDQATDVLLRPEHYLRAIQLTHLLGFLAVLFTGGLLIWRTGYPIAALLLQTTPLLAAPGLAALSQVGPESTLQFAVLALGLAAWRFASDPPRDELRYAIVFGVIAAFALATRMSALGLVIVPCLLLKTWRGRLVLATTTGAGATLVALSLIKKRWELLSVFLSHTRRTGTYGSEQKSLAAIDLYVDNTATLLRPHLAFFVVLGLGAMVWCWVWRRPDQFRNLGLRHRALGSVILGQALQVVIVAKSPAARYLLPATALAAFELALVWSILTARKKPAARPTWHAAVALALFAVPLALELPNHRGQFDYWRRGVQTQREIDSKIAEHPEDCLVIGAYRASSMPYALHFGQRMSARLPRLLLEQLYPREVFFNRREGQFEDFIETVPRSRIVQSSSCLLLRGRDRPTMEHQELVKTSTEALYSLTLSDSAAETVDTETPQSPREHRESTQSPLGVVQESSDTN